MKKFLKVSFILVIGLFLLTGTVSADTIVFNNFVGEEFIDLINSGTDGTPFTFINQDIPDGVPAGWEEAADLYARVTLTDDYVNKPADEVPGDAGWYPVYRYEYYFINTGLAPFIEEEGPPQIIGVSAAGEFILPVYAPLESVIAPGGVSFSPAEVVDGVYRPIMLSFLFDPGIAGGENSFDVLGNYFGFTSVFGPAVWGSGPTEGFVQIVDSMGNAFGESATGVITTEPDENYFGPVPEPGTLILVGTGLLGLAGFRRWRKKRV